MALTTQREESLRRLYVALTRARHQVHVMVSGTEKLAKSPLGYILFPQQEEPPSLESSTDDVLVAHIQSVVDASGGTMGLVDLNERLVPGTYSREKDDVHLTALKYTGRPLDNSGDGQAFLA